MLHNGPKGMTMPEERDYKCMCTPGDGNCLLCHAVLEQLQSCILGSNIAQ